MARRPIVGGPRVEPHPVTVVPDVKETVDFIARTDIEAMELWPRNQECERSAFAVPQKDDLVLAVSHAWVYSAHPDPGGLKKQTLEEMLKQAAAAHKPTSKTLMFIDFLSVSQRPVTREHADRTQEQEAAFAKALRAFPQIYLQADAVLHVDVDPSQIPGDSSVYSVSLGELEGASLMQRGDKLMVTKLPKDLDTLVNLFDVIDAVGGVNVRTVAEFEEAKKQLSERIARKSRSGGGGWFCAADSSCACMPSDSVRMRWSPYGAYSHLTAGTKGWVYLERFASMVKGAMVHEDQIESVAFASTPEAKAEILDGAKRLREAAALGRDKLFEAMSYFVDRLEEKHFTAVSLDKANNTGGVGGVTNGKDALQVKQVRDADIVGQLMRELVNDLADNWEKEQTRQRQRQLILAVHRGDLKAATQLIEGGADMNLPDGQGMTCMHQAAKGRNLDMVKLLVDLKGDLTMQDVQGNSPSHMVFLGAEPLTIDLLEVLAPTEEILMLTNNAGVTSFDRVEVWSGTAVKNRPYEPADALVKRLSADFPGLLQSRKAASDQRIVLEEKPVVVSHVDVQVGKRTIQVPVLHAPGSSEKDVCVVWVGMALYQPRPIQEKAVRSLVGMVSSKVNIKVYLLTEDIYCEEDCESGVLPLPQKTRGIKNVVDALPLKGKYIFVDNALGAAVPVLWENQARITHAMVINPLGWFSEEFCTSAGYRGMISKIAERSAKFKDRNIETFLDTFGSFVFTRTEKDIASSREVYDDALQRASPMFFAMAGASAITTAAATEMFSSLTTLGGGISLDLVCGAYSPAMLVQDTLARLQDVAPAGQMRYVANSKQWWEIEGDEQLTDVAILLLQAAQRPP